MCPDCFFGDVSPFSTNIHPSTPGCEASTPKQPSVRLPLSSDPTKHTNPDDVLVLDSPAAFVPGRDVLDRLMYFSCSIASMAKNVLSR